MARTKKPTSNVVDSFAKRGYTIIQKPTTAKEFLKKLLEYADSIGKESK